jgi:hypothetical protein
MLNIFLGFELLRGNHPENGFYLKNKLNQQKYCDQGQTEENSQTKLAFDEKPIFAYELDVVSVVIEEELIVACSHSQPSQSV